MSEMRKGVLYSALRWAVWAIPSVAAFFALYVAFVLPISIGATARLQGNLLPLAAGSITTALVAAVCIFSWLVVARLLPQLEQRWSFLVPSFVVWVCLLGELSTVLVYREDPHVLHLVPFSLTALVILFPRFLDRSLSIGSIRP